MRFIWCRHTDSNCGPTDYKSVALPTELCRRCVENFTEFLRVRKPKSNRLMQGIEFLKILYTVFWRVTNEEITQKVLRK